MQQLLNPRLNLIIVNLIIVDLIIASLARVFNVVFLSEPFDAACGVYQFLFAGKEGVAGGANFNLDVLYGGTGFDNVPACAGYFCKFISGVNSGFHFFLQKINLPNPP
jgi:hypothetical protein